MNIIMISNVSGLPGEKLSNLSAGTHYIVIKFVPTGSGDALSVSKRHRFEIEPIGAKYTCKQMTKLHIFIFSSWFCFCHWRYCYH